MNPIRRISYIFGHVWCYNYDWDTDRDICIHHFREKPLKFLTTLFCMLQVYLPMECQIESAIWMCVYIYREREIREIYTLLYIYIYTNVNTSAGYVWAVRLWWLCSTQHKEQHATMQQNIPPKILRRVLFTVACQNPNRQKKNSLVLFKNTLWVADHKGSGLVLFVFLVCSVNTFRWFPPFGGEVRLPTFL